LKYVCDIVVKTFTFAISSPGEFSFYTLCPKTISDTFGCDLSKHSIFIIFGRNVA